MIKASYEVLQPASGHSFLVRTFDKTAFDAPFHFHEEFELTYIVAGNGKRYTGNQMHDFSDGDLVLLGRNLPHCWKLDPGELSAIEPSAIVVQFSQGFLGEGFFNNPEMQRVAALLERSANGISFSGTTRASINKSLKMLTEEKSNFKMLIHLLEILQALAESAAFDLLDDQRSIAAHSMAEQERINLVFAYLVENFRTEVSLNEVAAIVHMTPNAFCKYFKKATRKTFMETVIGYRLNYATQQLVQTSKPISEISFESGFGDVSHFYKLFRKKMQRSPLSYRKNFMQGFNKTRV